MLQLMLYGFFRVVVNAGACGQEESPAVCIIAIVTEVTILYNSLNQRILKVTCNFPDLKITSENTKLTFEITANNANWRAVEEGGLFVLQQTKGLDTKETTTLTLNSFPTELAG